MYGSDSDDDYRASSSEEKEDHEIRRPPIHNPPSVSPVRRSAPASVPTPTPIPIPNPNPIPIPIHRKRKGESIVTPGGLPPLKRTRGDFNAGYLNLLNQDIQDASTGIVHDGAEAKPTPTQVGAVVWSATERAVFFSALSRLGRSDSAGIAARVGTKSELEVLQYLMLLDETERHHRRGDGGVGLGPSPGLHGLKPVDIPAAAEVSAGCCVALERAADGLSLLQEGYEEEIERERWGTRWLITPQLARILEMRARRSISSQRDPQQQKQKQQKRNEVLSSPPPNQQSPKKRYVQETGDIDDRSIDEMPFLHLFAVENWLELSNRIFMNSRVADGNWRAITYDEEGRGEDGAKGEAGEAGEAGEEVEEPAIRATALTDFHGLALSITRRLVSAALYVAESRIRAKSQGTGQRRVRRTVRTRDVAAAVSSLGMKENSAEFWRRCARRLQFDVVDDGMEDDEDDDDLVNEARNEKEKAIRENDASWNANQETLSDTAESSDADETGGEDDGNEGDVDDDYDIMTYDEVESALRWPPGTTEPSQEQQTDEPRNMDLSPSSTSEYESSSISQSESEFESESERDHQSDSNSDSDTKMRDRSSPRSKTNHGHDEEAEEEVEEDEEGLDEEAIARDLEEALVYSGGAYRSSASSSNNNNNNNNNNNSSNTGMGMGIDLDTAAARFSSTAIPPTSRRARTAMESRIRTEHKLERAAERLDMKNSAGVETELWAVLRGESDGKMMFANTARMNAKRRSSSRVGSFSSRKSMMMRDEDGDQDQGGGR